MMMTRYPISLRCFMLGLAVCLCVLFAGGTSLFAAEKPVKASPHETLIFHAYKPSVTTADKQVRAKAKAALNKMGLKRLEALMDFIHIKNIYIRIDAYALVMKSKADAELPIILEKYLDSEHDRTRRYAAFFFSLLDTPEMAPKLRPLLQDDKGRAFAIRALGKWKDLESLPEITKDLKHENERRRIMAVNALRDIGDAASAKPLIPLLDDPFFTVRYASERALTSLGELAEAGLIAASQDGSTRRRRHAVSALGQMKSEAARLTLNQLSNHEDWGLKGDARRALAMLDGDIPITSDTSLEDKKTDGPTHPYVDSSELLID